jgi:hypothetical protein
MGIDDGIAPVEFVEYRLESLVQAEAVVGGVLESRYLP